MWLSSGCVGHWLQQSLDAIGVALRLDLRTDVLIGQSRGQAANAPGNRAVVCKGGRRVVVTNEGLVHQIMAAHALVPIERVYGTIFENILGEKISTKPVDVVQPFTWVDKQGNRLKPEIRPNP